MKPVWFDPAWTWLPGTILGCMFGVWGCLASYFAARPNQHRFLVFATLGAFVVAGLVLLGLGVGAYYDGQPSDVWYGLGFAGLLSTIIVLCLALLIRNRFNKEIPPRRYPWLVVVLLAVPAVGFSVPFIFEAKRGIPELARAIVQVNSAAERIETEQRQISGNVSEDQRKEIRSVLIIGRDAVAHLQATLRQAAANGHPIKKWQLDDANAAIARITSASKTLLAKLKPRNTLDNWMSEIDEHIKEINVAK